MKLHIGLSPSGKLYGYQPVDESVGDGVAELPTGLAERLSSAFRQSSEEGLATLATPDFETTLPPEGHFWRDWSRGVFHSLCQLDQDQQQALTAAGSADAKSKTAADRLPLPPPEPMELLPLIAAAPPMRGLEYLSPATMIQLWRQLMTLIADRVAQKPGGLTELLREIHPDWQLLGRVTFHLAENKRNDQRPFAFLATFAHRLSAKSAVQHLPLAQALQQYASQRDQAKLQTLLEPVRKAAQRSKLIGQWLESRALFQPQALTIDQAHQFLAQVPLMEECGLAVRVPNWWRTRRPTRPMVQIQMGSHPPQGIGVGGLLDFNVALALDGEPLTAEEEAQLRDAQTGLISLRGQWVEVDQQRLDQALQHWRDLQSQHADGMNFLQGLRLLAGVQLSDDDLSLDSNSQWTAVQAGPWLKESLAKLRDPSAVRDCQPGRGLQATLRPYQADGVRWLWFMSRLGLGACLADDMGLGKTIQIIDLLLRLKQEPESSRSGKKRQEPQPTTSLLVVPASLVGNWKQELIRFAPNLRVFYAHTSETAAQTMDQVAADPLGELQDYDLVVTTYTLMRRAEWLVQPRWKLAILDEAQAIKNAHSAQTRAIKKIQAQQRIVLTGTPVENQLGDLWSLFDFCCPGLLGSARQFQKYAKQLSKHQDAKSFGTLRKLVQPYILRRMKTDPNIVPDLPDKTEMRAECGLAPKQAGLYQQVVDELARELEANQQRKDRGGIQRRGIVLAAMMRLKQICNHPAQYLGSTDYLPADSGKFERLAQLCQPISQRQEKVLVFTQFQSLCQALADYLHAVFGSPGLILHGGVAVGKRKELVRKFQEQDDLPFFVISVKAGGTGLNLTAASHVIHFDRWWNPAVENQATDRAFRIGQKRHVLVHKFVCRGTLEQRIDDLLRQKQDLSDKILGPKQEGEVLLTEMSDQELLDFVSLDIAQSQTM